MKLQTEEQIKAMYKKVKRGRENLDIAVFIWDEPQDNLAYMRNMYPNTTIINDNPYEYTPKQLEKKHPGSVGEDHMGRPIIQIYSYWIATHTSYIPVLTWENGEWISP